LRFRIAGTLWSADGEGNVAGWPAAAVVCNCMGVSRGELTRVVDEGCLGLDCLAGRTGASTVCGSCKPLLQQLLGVANFEPVRAFRVLVGAAFIAALATLFWFLPVAVPYADSVQSPLRIDSLWRNSLFKQISGFTLLGLSVVLALVSLRKRVSRLTLGSFDGWRAVHVITGTLVIVVLVAHTGFRLGDNINFYLMLVYAGLLLAGAAASAVMGLQHVLPIALARRVRQYSVWSHILLLWPLPALLGFHILKTYWY
jgi:nitrite reductase (NADH) large subunit